MVVAPLLDFYTHADVYSKSIRTIIHGANVYPSITGIEKVLAIGSEHFLEFSAMKTYCSDAVEVMAPAARGCNFEKEQKLRYIVGAWDDNVEYILYTHRTQHQQIFS